MCCDSFWSGRVKKIIIDPNDIWFCNNCGILNIKNHKCHSCGYAKNHVPQKAKPKEDKELV